MYHKVIRNNGFYILLKRYNAALTRDCDVGGTYIDFITTYPCNNR